MPLEVSHRVSRPVPPSWRPVPDLLRMCGRVDLRRPASWIALVAGGWLGWWCSSRTAAGDGIAMLSAAVLAVASIGDVPRAAFLPAGRWLPALWAGERATWPLVGTLCGALVWGGVPGAFGLVPAIVSGGLLATGTTVIARLSGVRAVDAASLSLLLAAASVAVGGGFASRPLGAYPVAVAAWLLLGGLGWAWGQSQRGAIDAFLPGPHRPAGAAIADVPEFDALPAEGPLRQTLTRLAMIAALAAMVGWLMLEPAADPMSGAAAGDVGSEVRWDRLVQTQRAAVAWALATSAWFVGLAVPWATQFDGPCGVAAWDVLFRSAAASRRTQRRGAGLLARLPVGGIKFGVAASLASAAILGWPPLVGGLLSLSRPTLAWPPLAIALGLAAAAAALAGLVIVAAIIDASRESLFAASLALVVAVAIPCLVTLFCAAATRLPASSPIPPKPPSPGLSMDAAAVAGISC